MDGNTTAGGHLLGGPSGFDDVSMSGHEGIVHYALEKSKCLLHVRSHYALCMNTANQRLRKAREAAGFLTAKDAAASMGVPLSTYTQHENGQRGIPRDRAPQYARKFKVTEEWLLYGKGEPDLEISLPEGAEPVEAIPILGEVPAGNWREAVRDYQGWTHVAAREVRAGMYALRVSGDSMDRIVQDGALIIIDPNDRDTFHRG